MKVSEVEGGSKSIYWRLAMVAGMASYLDSGLIVSSGIALAIWQKHYELTSFQLGLVSGILTLGIAVGALVGGRVADMFGRQRVFNIDILLYVVGVSIIIFAPSSGWLVFGVLVAGLAAGADLPTSIAIVSEYSPPEMRGRLVAFTHVMWIVGIFASTTLGFIFSTMGVLGIKLLFAHLAILGLATWLMRVLSNGFKGLEADAASRRTEDEKTAFPWRKLFTSRPMLRTLLLTCSFYVAWNLMANTIGQFKLYFLVSVSGATQSTATAVIMPTTMIAIIGGVLFVRLADTRYRRPAFYIGAALQIVAMVAAALSGGSNLMIMGLCLALYSISYPFAGEALYKVWTQERFPSNARSSVQGLTYAISRFICAGFALISPAIVNSNPQLLLWILAGCASVAALIGSRLIEDLKPKICSASVSKDASLISIK